MTDYRISSQGHIRIYYNYTLYIQEGKGKLYHTERWRYKKHFEELERKNTG